MTAQPTETMPLTRDQFGVILVGGTRVPLDTVIGAFHEGASAEDIVERYDTLDLKDVYLVIGYYLSHRDEIDAYLKERERQSEEIRKLNERRSNLREMRDRLLARREAMRAKQS